MEFAASVAPGPRMELRKIAPSPTLAPSKRMLPSTNAPSPMEHPLFIQVRPPTVAPAPISHSSATKTGGSRVTSLEIRADSWMLAYSNPFVRPMAPERTSWEAAR
jgi:hypothetical protein